MRQATEPGFTTFISNLMWFSTFHKSTSEFYRCHKINCKKKIKCCSFQKQNLVKILRFVARLNCALLFMQISVMAPWAFHFYSYPEIFFLKLKYPHFSKTSILTQFICKMPSLHWMWNKSKGLWSVFFFSAVITLSWLKSWGICVIFLL